MDKSIYNRARNELMVLTTFYFDTYWEFLKRWNDYVTTHKDSSPREEYDGFSEAKTDEEKEMLLIRLFTSNVKRFVFHFYHVMFDNAGTSVKYDEFDKEFRQQWIKVVNTMSYVLMDSDCANPVKSVDDQGTSVDTTLAEDEQYERVNHPQHYNNYRDEVIVMMEKIWGLDALIDFCEMNAFKYRMRMGTKPDNPIEQDMEKERWYLNKMRELIKKR